MASVATCLAVARADAQVLTGVLRGPDESTVLPGVVVAAVRATTGEPVARTLSGPSGTFRLLLGTDSVLVRALRIGQRPTTLFEGRLGAGEQRTLEVVLPSNPVAITGVRVRERSQCGPVTDDGGAVSTLFADVLTALSALSASELGDAAAPTVRSLRVEELRDRRDRVQRVEQAEVLEGASVQPFRSVPVDVILREGFVHRDERDARLYRAPDALLLIDRRFLERTCLSLDRSRESQGKLGVRFAPARRERDRVDTRGVLWVDAASRQLERLEFGYLGLDGESASTNPGGTVEYVRLPDGRWIIERWALRMPALVTEYGTDPSGRARLPRQRAVGARVVRGFVTDVRLGEQVLYSLGGSAAETALLRGLRHASPDSDDASIRTGTAASLASVGERQACADTDGTTSTLAVTVLDGAAAPRRGVLEEAAWRARYRFLSGASWDWELDRTSSTTDDQGAVTLCDVPRSQPVTVRALADGCAPVTMIWRPTESAGEGAVTLRLPAGCGH